MFNSLASAVSLGLALTTLASASAVLEYELTELVERQTTCPTGAHIMIAGGCNVPCVADNPDLLSTLIANISLAIPGSDQYIVPYDNSTIQAQEATPIMVAAANSYFTACPNTPIVFVGYSLGGIVILNTLCGGNVPYNKNVIAAIVFGEETFRYPASFDLGTCTASAPLYPRNNTAQCAPFAPVIQDYCDATDPRCCTGGTSTESHFAYDAKYDLVATNFAKSQFALYEAGLLGVTTTSSSSVAPSTSTTSTTSTTSIVVPTTTSTTSTTSTLPVVIPTPSTTSTTVVPTTTSTSPVVVPIPSTTTVLFTTPSTSVTPVPSPSTTVIPVPSPSSSAVVVPVPGTTTSGVVVSSVAVTTTIKPASGTVSAVVSVTTIPVVVSSKAVTSTIIPASGTVSAVVSVTTIPIVLSTASPVYPISNATVSHSTVVGTSISGSGPKPSTPTVTPYTGAAARLPIPGAALFQFVNSAMRVVVA